MNNDYIDGFLKFALDQGCSGEEAVNLFKFAAETDPGVAEAAGLGAGISAPGPEQLGQGQPGLEGQGIPPEIEQLIQSLPPEVLQQLMMEIEQELQGGMPKQGSDNSEASTLCKTAEYAEGFLSAAKAEASELSEPCFGIPPCNSCSISIISCCNTSGGKL
jgi:hypothetical protein